MTKEKQNAHALLIAIHAAMASRVETVGLSANRRDTGNGYEWDIFIGAADPGHMTIIDSQGDYSNKSANEIANVILDCWEEEWDD